MTLVVKNPPANAGDVRDTGSVPGSGKYPEEGHGNPLQYSCPENPTDRGAWEPGRLQFSGVTKSPTQLSNLAAAEYLVYNIELIFSVQQSDSLCIYILFIFLSLWFLTGF